MEIRKVKKYRVINRFSIGMKMCDKQEILYIEEPSPEMEDVQKVFGKDKGYLNDISSEMFDALKKGFIKKV
ncbi:hypothetical protein M3P19_10865 [Muricauda sp. 2012CJ35-5]|uniref:Uncharacterized protein n=1 Tax=Flagellimonas spongiicola TaxID=2942208 RepID=A0ABT0PT01_9FLAO|nr:hypothetical protein [Allomuricauda spongiicola]MCL6274515.1 hypothetical protein [Allomuricauda spongiicola]